MAIGKKTTLVDGIFMSPVFLPRVTVRSEFSRPPVGSFLIKTHCVCTPRVLADCTVRRKVKRLARLYIEHFSNQPNRLKSRRFALFAHSNNNRPHGVDFDSIYTSRFRDFGPNWGARERPALSFSLNIYAPKFLLYTYLYI